MNPPYHTAAIEPISLALPGHKSVIEVADRNRNIVIGKLSKSLKQQTPDRPWDHKDFFTTMGYNTHPLEGYVPKPESETILSRKLTAVCTQKNHNDPKTRAILFWVNLHSVTLKLLILRLLIGRQPQQLALLYPWLSTCLTSQGYRMNQGRFCTTSSLIW